jgi:hypothetical protein
LHQKCRQQHIAAHLQELGLPVLKGRLNKVTAAEVLPVRLGRPAGFQQLIVTDLPAEQTLQHDEHHERGEHHQRQSVEPQPPLGGAAW